jgi:hypothetical protein
MAQMLESEALQNTKVYLSHWERARLRKTALLAKGNNVGFDF